MIYLTNTIPETSIQDAANEQWERREKEQPGREEQDAVVLGASESLTRSEHEGEEQGRLMKEQRGPSEHDTARGASLPQRDCAGEKTVASTAVYPRLISMPPQIHLFRTQTLLSVSQTHTVRLNKPFQSTGRICP